MKKLTHYIRLVQEVPSGINIVQGCKGKDDEFLFRHERHEAMSGSSSGFCSPSSSTDSTSPGPYFSDRQWARDLSSNLIHDLSFSKPKNRNKDDKRSGQPSFLFVKVYMEGMPIGRKLNLYALHSYNDLIATLSNMFAISIYSTCLEDMDKCKAHLFNCSMLTYQDADGEWMMVGDVPWELFLITVKRLKNTNPYLWSRHLRDRNDVI